MISRLDSVATRTATLNTMKNRASDIMNNPCNLVLSPDPSDKTVNTYLKDQDIFFQAGSTCRNANKIPTASCRTGYTDPKSNDGLRCSVSKCKYGSSWVKEERFCECVKPTSYKELKGVVAWDPSIKNGPNQDVDFAFEPPLVVFPEEVGGQNNRYCEFMSDAGVCSAIANSWKGTTPICGPADMEFHPTCEGYGKLTCKCPTIQRQGKPFSVLTNDVCSNNICDRNDSELPTGYCNHKSSSGNKCKLVKSSFTDPNAWKINPTFDVKCTCKSRLAYIVEFLNFEQVDAERYVTYSGAYCNIRRPSQCYDTNQCGQNKDPRNECKPSDMVNGGKIKCKYYNICNDDSKNPCRTIDGSKCTFKQNTGISKCVCKSGWEDVDGKCHRKTTTTKSTVKPTDTSKMNPVTNRSDSVIGPEPDQGNVNLIVPLIIVFLCILLCCGCCCFDRQAKKSKSGQPRPTKTKTPHRKDLKSQHSVKSTTQLVPDSPQHASVKATKEQDAFLDIKNSDGLSIERNSWDDYWDVRKSVVDKFLCRAQEQQQSNFGLEKEPDNSPDSSPDKSKNSPKKQASTKM